MVESIGGKSSEELPVVDEMPPEEPKTPPASPTSKKSPDDSFSPSNSVKPDQVESRLELDSKPQQELRALQKLFYAAKVINQTVGDALSDMLLVEVVLSLGGLSIKQWDEFYQDLPNRQLKVKVADRNVVQTTDAERKCLAPRDLQPAIDKIVYQYPSARAFVR